MENIPIFVWQINSSIRMKLSLTLYYNVFPYSSFALSQANSWKPLEDAEASLQWDFLFWGSVVACSGGWFCPVCIGLWQKGVEGDCEVTLCKAALATVEFRAKWNGLWGCLLDRAASSAALCAAAGAGSETLECWIYSISLRFPSAGSLPRGIVPLKLMGALGPGHSFHFKHISVMWEKSGAPHLAVFSHATILFQMKYDNTTVAVITVIDFREFKMIM